MRSNNEQPLISIIVPVYKVEQYLDRCVESIVNQTYKNLEIILVDDGSPDNCPTMCDEWACKDERIRVIHSQNLGVSNARNLGIRFSNGEYLAFVDSDDWVDENYIELMYTTACDNDCDIVECGYITAYDENCSVYRLPSKDATIYTSEEALYCNLTSSAFVDVVWNRLYRRSVVAVEFEVGKFHEDVYWVYQVLAKANKLARIENLLYYYFQREHSFMAEEYTEKRIHAIFAGELRSKFVIENHSRLASLAQSQFIGMCMYHSQKLLQFKIKGYNDYFKDLHIRSKKIGDDWSKGLSKKQRLWIGLYLACPKFVCTIRNLLKIGI